MVFTQRSGPNQARQVGKPIMDTRRETGCTYLFPKTSGEPYILPCIVYESVLAAWHAGDTFFTTTNLWGGLCSFRLNDIVCISQSLPATITNARAELAELKARDIAEGMD